MIKIVLLEWLDKHYNKLKYTFNVISIKLVYHVFKYIYIIHL